MKKCSRFGLSIFMGMLVFGATAVSETRAQGRLGEVLRRMDVHNKALTSLSAKITLVKQNTQLKDDPEARIGTVIYARDNKKEALVRIDWQRPQESVSTMDGRYVLFQPRNKIAYTGLVKGVTSDGSSVFAFMNMSKAQLDASYSAEYLGEGTLSDGTRTVQLRLTPKTKTSYTSAELWVDVDGMLRQAKIIENNYTTTMLLSGLKKNGKLKKSSFQISLPRNTKIEKT